MQTGTHRFRNGTKRAIRLMIEPWAEQVEIPMEGTVTVRVMGEETVANSSHFELVKDGLKFWCEGEDCRVWLNEVEIKL